MVHILFLVLLLVLPLSLGVFGRCGRVRRSGIGCLPPLSLGHSCGCVDLQMFEASFSKECTHTTLNIILIMCIVYMSRVCVVCVS